jgi:hypothetical protein
MKKMFARAEALAVVLCFVATTARAGVTITLDPTATYLHTNNDNAGDATAYSLSTLGFAPGQTITFTEVGGWNNGNGSTYYSVDAVFSGSDVLLGSGLLNRVQDAIGVGGFNATVTEPTFFGSEPTDIPQDFYISLDSTPGGSATLTIPAGAAYIFFSPNDDLFQDNSNATSPPFGVTISRASVPEPSSLVLLVTSVLFSPALALARRRNRRRAARAA